MKAAKREGWVPPLYAVASNSHCLYGHQAMTALTFFKVTIMMLNGAMPRSKLSFGANQHTD